MAKEECFIIAREGVSGGTGTLSLRLFEYIKQEGGRCVYLCCENNAPQNYALMERVVDEIVCVQDISFTKQFDSIKNKYKSFCFLTYSIAEYVAISTLRNKCDKIKRVIYYVVHDYAFSIPPSLQLNKFRRTIIPVFQRLKYRKLVSTLMVNRSIVFMDDISLMETKKNLRIGNLPSIVQLLPINIPNLLPEDFKVIKRHKPFTIGTMCRMEFPMKGYVLGLIDKICELSNVYDIRLILVGDGPGRVLVEEKLNCLPTNNRGKIEYIRSLPYSEIGNFYSQCDLALGMGTMLLDASINKVLAVPVRSYTNDLVVSALFLDKVEWLLFDKMDEKPFEGILSYLLALEDDEFNLLVERQFLNVRNAYNINDFIRLLQDNSVGANTLNSRELWFFKMLNKII
ncbi:MAG: glycosyltransferase [Bacteroidales bacterium]|nr:glycosyltransferase [Bacteroidales bacterium]